MLYKILKTSILIKNFVSLSWEVKKIESQLKFLIKLLIVNIFGLNKIKLSILELGMRFFFLRWFKLLFDNN